MRTSYKWGLVGIVFALAAYGLTPTIVDVTSDGSLDRKAGTNAQGKKIDLRKAYNGTPLDWILERAKPLTLGLDLQGGLLLQYKVLLERAVLDKLDRMARDIEARLKEKDSDVKVKVDHPEGTHYIQVVFQNPDKRSLLDSDLMSYFPNVEKIDRGGGTVRLQMTEDYIEKTKKFAVKQAVQTIRKRVNALGVTEPEITRRGGSDIVIQLPGLEEDDRERAKELIGQTARLVFRMVDDKGTNEFFRRVSEDMPAGFKLRRGSQYLTITHKNKEKLKSFLEPKTDDKHTVGFEHKLVYKDRENKIIDKDKSYWKAYYLFSEVKLTGERIQSARVSTDRRTNRPVVSLTFDRKGAEIFAKLTRKNVDKRFAIMLDDEVKSAPVINEPIPGGQAQISMGSLRSYKQIQQEAQNLVIVLRHGALPAPIELQYQTAVGPTLGKQSIRSSTWALIVGSVLIILFMLIYYRGSGLISVLALLSNLILILAALAGLGATLTLPGIAGIILTVGMAVDANVIIFERIREERRDGKMAVESVDGGFDHALSAVLDANVTTGIAAIVLLQYGTGPIRGFAVTLLIGIAGTLFTAVFLSRLLFDTWFEWKSDADRVPVSI
ncbi:MAG: protein translocase subunit SecD [Bradymonadaceae bacterium]